MQLRINYPSGNQIDVQGYWEGPRLIGDDLVPCITVSKGKRIADTFVNRGEILICDPRAIIQDADAVLYNPRWPLIYDTLTAEWQQWLIENPDWPGILEI